MTYGARRREPLASEASRSGGFTKLLALVSCSALLGSERLLAIAALDVRIECDEPLTMVEGEKGSNVCLNEGMPRPNVLLQGRNNNGTACAAIPGLKYEIDAL